MKKTRNITYTKPLLITLPDGELVQIDFEEDKLQKKTYLLVTNLHDKGRVNMTSAVELGEPYMLIPQKRTFLQWLFRNPIVMKSVKIGGD